jgi:protein-S-isoprenylcysteine O-methyltransferase Ste14
MDRDLWHSLIGICWIVFVVYWFVAARFVRPTAKRDSPFARFLQIVLLTPAIILLFSPSARIGFLRARFVPHTPFFAALGFVLTACGIGIAIWARNHIGQYWSSNITLKTEHKLIRTGPYAAMRHPIYSGLLLAFIGTGLANGEWRAVIAVVLIFLSHSWKALREEALLRTAFGVEYDEYRRHTGFLFPHF